MPKPPSSTLKAYRVRIDGEGDERLTAFCKKYCDRWLLVHHVTQTENPHFHMYCETTLSQGNFSNKIKAELQVSGGDYSNKSCDTDRKIEYLSYLFNTKKGNVSRLVSYEGFSVIDVATYKENSEKISKEFTARMQASKKTQFEIAMLVIERMPTNKIAFPEVIYDVVIDVLKEARTMARPNHVKDIIATVMAFGNNKYAKQQIKDLTLKFFS